MKETILKRYPELSEDDIVLRDDNGDGVNIYIDYWNSDLPIPTPTEIKQWEDEEKFIITKENKWNELDSACTNAILGRFKAILDGVEYEFSYDDQAQSRFNGTPYLFSSGIATSIEWTAYLNGQRTSVFLDEVKFNTVAKAAFNHQNANIAKFRQKITELTAVQNIPDFELIQW